MIRHPRDLHLHAVQRTLGPAEFDQPSQDHLLAHALATFGDIDLTDGELLSTLASAIQSHARYMIRMERHNTYSEPGGVLCGRPRCRCAKVAP